MEYEAKLLTGSRKREERRIMLEIVQAQTWRVDEMGPHLFEFSSFGMT